eukprot:scaffold3754_cov134-Skeletonema_dohrnii-CCMP3373.AAC.2
MTNDVTTMCSGCKRVLCFDRDRREVIVDLLDGEDGDRLRQEFPSLSNLRSGDAPAYYTEVGLVNKRTFFMGMSCWHLAHTNQLCSPCNEEDAQLSSVIAAGEDVVNLMCFNDPQDISSPAARLTRFNDDVVVVYVQVDTDRNRPEAPDSTKMPDVSPTKPSYFSGTFVIYSAAVAIHTETIILRMPPLKTPVVTTLSTSDDILRDRRVSVCVLCLH